MANIMTTNTILTSKRVLKAAAMVHFRIAIIVLGFLLTAGKAVSATLNDLTFSELPGGRIEVRASFSEPPSTPAGYAIEQPARIVLDFEGGR